MSPGWPPQPRSRHRSPRPRTPRTPGSRPVPVPRSRLPDTSPGSPQARARHRARTRTRRSTRLSARMPGWPRVQGTLRNPVWPRPGWPREPVLPSLPRSPRARRPPRRPGWPQVPGLPSRSQPSSPSPRAPGLASGTGTAQPPAVTFAVSPSASLATGTGTAQPTFSRHRPPGRARCGHRHRSAGYSRDHGQRHGTGCYGNRDRAARRGSSCRQRFCRARHGCGCRAGSCCRDHGQRHRRARHRDRIRIAAGDGPGSAGHRSRSRAGYRVPVRAGQCRYRGRDRAGRHDHHELDGKRPGHGRHGHRDRPACSSPRQARTPAWLPGPERLSLLRLPSLSSPWPGSPRVPGPPSQPPTRLLPARAWPPAPELRSRLRSPRQRPRMPRPARPPELVQHRQSRLLFPQMPGSPPEQAPPSSHRSPPRRRPALRPRSPRVRAWPCRPGWRRPGCLPRQVPLRHRRSPLPGPRQPGWPPGREPRSRPR